MEKGTKLLEGSIWKGIVAFAIPLFLGNLFQQLYNTVDSLIVAISWQRCACRCQFIWKPDFSSGGYFNGLPLVQAL